MSVPIRIPPYAGFPYRQRSPGRVRHGKAVDAGNGDGNGLFRRRAMFIDNGYREFFNMRFTLAQPLNGLGIVVELIRPCAVRIDRQGAVFRFKNGRGAAFGGFVARLRQFPVVSGNKERLVRPGVGIHIRYGELPSTFVRSGILRETGLLAFKLQFRAIIRSLDGDGDLGIRPSAVLILHADSERLRDGRAAGKALRVCGVVIKRIGIGAVGIQRHDAILGGDAGYGSTGSVDKMKSDIVVIGIIAGQGAGYGWNSGVLFIAAVEYARFLDCKAAGIV